MESTVSQYDQEFISEQQRLASLPIMRKAPAVDLKELMMLRKKNIAVEQPKFGAAKQRKESLKLEQLAEQTNERASPIQKTEGGSGRNSANELQQSTDMKLMLKLGLDEDKLMQLRYFNSTNGDTLLDFKQEIEFKKHIKAQDDKLKKIQEEIDASRRAEYEKAYANVAKLLPPGFDQQQIRLALKPMTLYVDDCEKQVREARLELMNTNKEMAAKNLAIKKLEKNNEKYMNMVTQKHQWEDYQQLLAVEKRISRQLLSILSEKQSFEDIDRLKKNTYRDYLRNNSNFGYEVDPLIAESAGSFFPRREKAPKY